MLSFLFCAAALRVLARLLKIERDGIRLLFHKLHKLVYPLEVGFCYLCDALESARLVRHSVPDISVLNESWKDVVSSGGESRVYKPIDIVGDSAGDDTELLTAYLVKLNVSVQKRVVVLVIAHTRQTFP